MTTFDPALHPRGNAQNSGQFATKLNTAQTGGLVAPVAGEDDELELDGWRDAMKDTHNGVWNVTARPDEDNPDVVNVEIELYENITHDESFGSPELQAHVLDKHFGLVRGAYEQRYGADINTDSDEGWGSAGVSIRVPVDRFQFEDDEDGAFRTAHQKLADFTNESDRGTFGSEYFPAKVWKDIEQAEAAERVRTDAALADAIADYSSLPSTASFSSRAEWGGRIEKAAAGAVAAFAPRGTEAIIFEHGDNGGLQAKGAEGIDVSMDDSAWSDVDFYASNIRDHELAGMTKNGVGTFRLEVR